MKKNVTGDWWHQTFRQWPFLFPCTKRSCEVQIHQQLCIHYNERFRINTYYWYGSFFFLLLAFILLNIILLCFFHPQLPQTNQWWAQCQLKWMLGWLFLSLVLSVTHVHRILQSFHGVFPISPARCRTLWYHEAPGRGRPPLVSLFLKETGSKAWPVQPSSGVEFNKAAPSL